MCSQYTAAVDVWSIGCIMAELILRRPVFPGKDYVKQLQLIFDVIGTPKPGSEETSHITNPDAVRFLKEIRRRSPKPWRSILPKSACSDEAVDLIAKMLVFNPKDRITVEQALAHPYLKALHDPEDEPVCTKDFSFDFDKDDMSEPELRDYIWKEVVSFHPEGLDEDPEVPVEMPPK
jgi:serine/threonine protein kinase